MATLDSLLSNYPASRPVEIAEILNLRAERTNRQVFIVLDDDPTGTQSVHDIPVLTAWDADDMRWALQTGAPAVYVMTNSRSLSPADAEQVNREVAAVAIQVAGELGLDISFVSRSDSTLRGHFPLEPDVLADVLASHGVKTDGVVVVPAFPDAGRVTINGRHYALVAGDYIPVGESEFAKDATFGYHASDLADWVAERSCGKINADDVELASLSDIRQDPKVLAKLCESAHDGQIICGDAVVEDDLRGLALACNAAENAGRKLIYRSGPPFVRALMGLELCPALSEVCDRDDWDVPWQASERPGYAGGLVVVGSHVGLTSRQLAKLLESQPANVVELSVAEVLGENAEAHLVATIEAVKAGLEKGLTVLHTSRQLVTGANGASSLEISRNVSAALVDVVARVVADKQPRFVIAKGGITSSDVASKGLSIRRATAVGPVLAPGLLSLWVSEAGHTAGLPYVVFPGNVGGEESLAEAVQVLSKITD